VGREEGRRWVGGERERLRVFLEERGMDPPLHPHPAHLTHRDLDGFSGGEECEVQGGHEVTHEAQ